MVLLCYSIERSCSPYSDMCDSKTLSLMFFIIAVVVEAKANDKRLKLTMAADAGPRRSMSCEGEW